MPREKDSNVKVPLLDGPSYIYHVHVREKQNLIHEAFLSPNARERAKSERCEREKRERATFATTRREFGRVGCFDGVRD